MYKQKKPLTLSSGLWAGCVTALVLIVAGAAGVQNTNAMSDSGPSFFKQLGMGVLQIATVAEFDDEDESEDEDEFEDDADEQEDEWGDESDDTDELEDGDDEQDDDRGRFETKAAERKAEMEKKRMEIEAKTEERKAEMEQKRAEFEQKSAERKEEMEIKRTEWETKVTERKEKLEQKRSELASSTAARKAALQERVQEKVKQAGERVSGALEHAIDKIEELSGRLQNRADELSARGVDTSEVDVLLDEANSTLDAARIALSDIDVNIEYAATSDDPRTDWQDAKAQFLEVRELIRTAHSTLRDALAALKNAVVASNLDRGVSAATRQDDNENDDEDETEGSDDGTATTTVE